MRQQGVPSELFLAVVVAMVLGVAYFVEHLHTNLKKRQSIA